MIFSIIPFVLFYYLKKDNKFDDVSIYLLITLTIFIGYRFGSEALYLSYLVPVVVVLFFLSNRFLKLLIILLVILSIIYFFYNYVDILRLMGKKAFHIDGRFALLVNAIDIKMLLFGFGPGPHSHNTWGDPNKLWEAHNTFVDWYSQAGLIGIFIYSFLIYKITKRLYLTKEYVLLSAFYSLIIFSLFHFVFRQPVFWLYFYFFYEVSKYKIECLKVKEN